MTTKHRVTHPEHGAYSFWTTTDGKQAIDDLPSGAGSGFVRYPFVEIQSDDAVGSDDSAWRQKVAQGINVTHDYARRAFRVEQRTTFHAVTKDDKLQKSGWVNPQAVYEECWGSYPNGMANFPSLDSKAVNQALSSFVSKASSAITPFQGGVFLGELKETIHTIRHPCEGVKKLLGSYLSNLKKARPGFKKATQARRAQYVASQWLETSYGIRPLISDIQSGVKAVSDIINYRANSQVIKGFGKSRSDYSDGGSAQLNFRYTHVFFKLTSYTETKAVYYGAVRMNFPSTAGFIQQKLGLSLNQFLPTVWELIPYSFLVDYFTNVGQFVQAVSFPTQNLAWWGSTVVIKGINIADAFSSETSPPGLATSFTPGKTKVVCTDMTRSVTPPLIPSLSFHIPTGVGQWTNMAALAIQARSLTPY